MQCMTPILSILDNSVLCSSQFIISDIFHESYSLHSIVISQNKSTFHELFLYHYNIGFPAFFSSFPLFFLLLKKIKIKCKPRSFTVWFTHFSKFLSIYPQHEPSILLCSLLLKHTVFFSASRQHYSCIYYKPGGFLSRTL